jgi:hypothetical protein
MEPLVRRTTDSAMGSRDTLITGHMRINAEPPNPLGRGDMGTLYTGSGAVATHDPQLSVAKANFGAGVIGPIALRPVHVAEVSHPTVAAVLKCRSRLGRLHGQGGVGALASSQEVLLKCAQLFVTKRVDFDVTRRVREHESAGRPVRRVFRAEQSKLRTAERLVNLLGTLCVVGWLWLTMLNYSTRKARPTLAFTPLEVDLLNRLTHPPPRAQLRPPTLSSCLTQLAQLAQLGGYLARAGDAPPGNTVIWRGLARLTDIEIGFLLGSQFVGN